MPKDKQLFESVRSVRPSHMHKEVIEKLQQEYEDGKRRSPRWSEWVREQEIKYLNA